MRDRRFDRCIMFAENSSDALDWPSLPREGHRPTRLLASCPFETTLPLEGDTLGYSAAPVCALVQQQHYLQQQHQQAAEEAGRSS